MTWLVSYADPPTCGASAWREQQHASRADALRFSEAVLRFGGVVRSITERRSDGSVAERLDDRAVLRELNIPEDGAAAVR